MLGRQRFILLVIFVVGSVYLGLERRRAQILNALAYVTVIFVAYLIPTLNWQKTQFFGLVFHLMLIFSALLIMRHVIEVAGEHDSMPPWAGIVMVAVSSAIFLLFFGGRSVRRQLLIASVDKRSPPPSPA